jgi:hypothetical protein
VHRLVPVTVTAAAVVVAVAMTIAGAEGGGGTVLARARTLPGRQQQRVGRPRQASASSINGDGGGDDGHGFIEGFPSVYTVTVHMAATAEEEEVDGVGVVAEDDESWTTKTRRNRQKALQVDLLRHLDVLGTDCGGADGEGRKEDRLPRPSFVLSCQFHALLEPEEEHGRVQDLMATVVGQAEGSEEVTLVETDVPGTGPVVSVTASSTSSFSSISLGYNSTLTELWIVPRRRIQLYHQEREEEERRRRRLALPAGEEEEEEEASRRQQQQQPRADQQRQLQQQDGSSAFSWTPWGSNSINSQGKPYASIYTKDCYLDYVGTMEWIQDLIVAASSITPSLQIEWKDIGDSYLKTVNGGGYDINVLTITLAEDPDRNNLDDDDGTGSSTGNTSKAPLFLVSSTHPREYAPVELVRRWISNVVEYVSDPTSERHHQYLSLLHATTIHWIPYLNPDGRVLAETVQPYRRKNLNPTWDSGSILCPDDSFGVDINRNLPFVWGDDEGSSAYACSPTSRGGGPGSEPETQAFVSYTRSVFPLQQQEQSFDQWQQRQQEWVEKDRAASNDTSSVEVATISFTEFSSLSLSWGGYNESTTSGVFVDVHSYGNVYIFPWGHVNFETPNHGSLLAGIDKMASMTSCVPAGPGPDFFSPASGATDDYSYGVLGAFGMTWEIGTSFHEECTDFEEALEGHFRAFEYLASISPLPFALSKGPDVLPASLVITPAVLEYGTALAVAIEASDGAMTSNPTTTTSAQQAVVEIRIYGQHPLVVTDTTYTNPPLWSWTDTDANFLPLSDSNGIGNGALVQATIPWEEVYGKVGPSLNGTADPHFLYVQARDSDGSWGPVTVTTLVVDASGMPLSATTAPPTVSPVADGAAADDAPAAAFAPSSPSLSSSLSSSPSSSSTSTSPSDRPIAVPSDIPSDVPSGIPSATPSVNDDDNDEQRTAGLSGHPTETTTSVPVQSPPLSPSAVSQEVPSDAGGDDGTDMAIMDSAASTGSSAMMMMMTTMMMAMTTMALTIGGLLVPSPW